MSHRKAQAARANGVHSHGLGPGPQIGRLPNEPGIVQPQPPQPGTIAPPTDSSASWFSSRALALNNEDAAKLQSLTDGYLARFQPADPVEEDLVTEMVAARWRLLRIWAIETATLDLQMDKQAAQLKRDFVNCDEPTRTAVAFDTLANNGLSLALLQRYETRYSRQYHRALKALLDLQSRRPGQATEPENKNLPSEPTTAQPESVQPLAAASSTSSASSRDRTALLSDDWIRFRVTFVNALRDFPDAYNAVVAALRLCRTTYHLPDPPLP